MLTLSQDRTIYGRVLDNNNSPVSDVLVELLDTNQQTITDKMGRFYLNVPKGNRSVLFTHSDFQSKKIRLRGPYWKEPFYIKLISLNNIPNDSIIPQSRKIKTFTLQEEINKCYNKRGNKSKVDKTYNVLFVLTKKGDSIIFNENYPGRVIDTGIFGFPQKILPYEAIDSTVFNMETIESLWKDGIEYKFIAQQDSGYLCHLADTVNIPLADVDLMQVRIKKYGWVAAAIIVPVATVVAVGISALAKSARESAEDMSFHIK